MADFVAALGLVLVVEGLFYGGMPNLAKKLAAEVMRLPEGSLRAGGIASMVLGVVIVWMVRG